MGLAPLLSAPVQVQLHVILGVSALVVGAARLVLPEGNRLEHGMGWTFLALLLLTTLSALLIPMPAGTPNLMGVTPMHGFAVVALAGAGAAVVAARQGDRHRWNKIVTATFAGVLLMAGLFEVVPGRLLNTVLGGG
jgi:uncharacterized membrane protein